jgi:hypothetical protein
VAVGDYGGYWAWVNPDGELGITVINRLEELARVNVGIDVSREDVMLRFDLSGNYLSLWAWRPGSTMPTEPQIMLSDGTYSSGVTTLFTQASVAGTPNESSQGIFRFVDVVPEPSMAVLFTVGLVALLALHVGRAGLT